MATPSRGLTFHQEIEGAVAARERLLLVVGPKAAMSDAATGSGDPRRAQFELQADKAVSPILRQGDYPLVPDELKLLHCEDFRDAAQYALHLENLVRQLRAPVPPLGKRIAVPSLPAHYRSRADRLRTLRDALRADLDRPVEVSFDGAWRPTT